MSDIIASALFLVCAYVLFGAFLAGMFSEGTVSDVHWRWVWAWPFYLAAFVGAVVRELFS